MASEILYLDGMVGLGEHEGDAWAYGPRFQVPQGDKDGIRNHIFKNEGKYFADALGGDYNVWFGENSYIVPKDLATGYYPWMQAGGWFKYGSPPTGTLSLPFKFARFRHSGVAWYADTPYFKIASDDQIWFDVNAAGEHFDVLPNQWFWLECRIYGHTSSGVAEIRINESITKRWTGIQTIDTSGVGPPTGEIDLNSQRLLFSDYYSTTYDPKCDNLYVIFADSEGELAWLGEAVCEHIIPKGAGDETNGTPTGATNYASVAFPINDSICVEAGAGDRDCYSFSNMETDRTRTVHGVKTTTRARKSNAGTATIRCYCRIGSTNYYGDTHYLSPEWREYVHIWQLNPDTSSDWTSSEVNAAQFGWERVA